MRNKKDRKKDPTNKTIEELRIENEILKKPVNIGQNEHNLMAGGSEFSPLWDIRDPLIPFITRYFHT